MSLFNRLTIEVEPATAPEAVAPFQLIKDAQDKCCALLLFRRPGRDADAEILWSRGFASCGLRNAVLAHVATTIDITSWGRLVMAMGVPALDGIVDEIAADASRQLALDQTEVRERAATRSRVQFFVKDKKGRYYITLQRESDDKPAWSMVFADRAERERMRDWLRWQGRRFLEFVDYADKHGGAALEKRLIDEMCEAERRMKQLGRATGGLRPLRMWRGV